MCASFDRACVDSVDQRLHPQHCLAFCQFMKSCVLLTAWILICMCSFSEAFNTDPCSARHSAEKIFQHWKLRTGASMQALQLLRKSQQHTGLEFEAFQNGQVCLLKVSYDGHGHFSAVPPGKGGESFCVKEVSFAIRSVRGSQITPHCIIFHYSHGHLWDVTIQSSKYHQCSCVSV